TNHFFMLKNNLVILFVLISITVFLFPEVLISVLVPGITSETRELSIYLLRWSIFSLIFIGLVNIYNGFLQSIKIYGSEQYISIINNIVFIIIIATLFDRVGIHAIILAIVLGSFFQYIFIKYKFSQSVEINNSYEKYKVNLHSLKKFISDNRLIIYGGALSQATILLDKFFASFFAVGSITALHYANTINNLPLTMVLMVITNIFFTNLTLDFKQGEKVLKESIINQTEKILMFIMPIIIFIIINASNIVNLLFNRGSFDNNGVIMISSALIAYSFGLILWGTKDVFIKASYVVGNKSLPFKVTICSLIMNTVLNLILGYFWGHVGIALATSISIFMSAILITYLFQTQIFKVYTRQHFKFIIKLALIAIITFCLVSLLDTYFLVRFNDFIQVALSLTITAMIYSALLYFSFKYKGWEK
ncbi:lipid II flippase MurJ, partial [Lacicoccus alkaliphilus]